MQLITAHCGKIFTLNSELSTGTVAGKERSFSSGLPDLDAIAPGGAFARGAIHELLTAPADGKALFLAMMLAAVAGRGQGDRETGGQGDRGTGRQGDRGTRRQEDLNAIQTRESRAFQGDRSVSLSPCPPVSLSPRLLVPPSPCPPVSVSPCLPVSPASGVIIWSDPDHTLYPPALAAYGFPLDRLLLLRPKLPDPQGKELNWAIAECLRCKGVSAVVAAPGKLSRIEARRLQLAAEAGGGVGLLLRHVGKESAHHASATRWLVRPAPGSRTIQRWTIQLLHGHGGRVGQTLCLEHCRETNHLHTFDPVADRSTAEKQAAG